MNGTLTALSDPNRLRIVELLRERPYTVNEIVERLGLTQPLVSKHLRVLRQAGLVHARPHGQQRFYELQGEPFKELDSWVSTFRQLWEGRMDRLDNYLQHAQRRPKRPRK